MGADDCRRPRIDTLKELDTAPEGGDAPSDHHILAAAKGGGFLAAGDLSTFAARFLSALLLARLLGAESYGLYSLGLSAAFIAASVSSFGLDSAMERFVAVFNARHDEGGVRGSIQVGLIGTLIGTVAAGVLVAAFAVPIAESVFNEPQLVPLLRFAGILIPLIGLSSLLLAVVRGFKRMDLAALAEDVVQPYSRLILIGIGALVGLTAFNASVIHGISYLLSVAVLVFIINRRVPLFGRTHEVHRDVRSIGWFALPFWVSGVLSKVRKNLQTILLGAMSSIANVGIFSLISNANLAGRIALQSVTASVRPILAELLDRGEIGQVERLYATATRWTLITNLPVFIILVLFPESILALFGQSFVVGASALVVLACAELVNAATGVVGSVIDMSGFNRVKLANSVVKLVLSLGMNVLLIPQYGVLGAALAVLIANGTINLIRVVEVWIILRIQPWNRRTLKPILAAIVALGVGLGMRQLADAPIGPVVLFLIAAGVAAVYFGVLVLLGLDADDRMVLERLMSTLRRRFGRSSANQTRQDVDKVTSDDSPGGSS